MYIKMFEEAKAKAEPAEDECSFCNRPKTAVKCGTCLFFVGNNVRVRKICPSHPKQFFLQDMDKCPKCKSTDLREKGIDRKPGKEGTMTPTPSSVTPMHVEASPQTPAQQFAAAIVQMPITPVNYDTPRAGRTQILIPAAGKTTPVHATFGSSAAYVGTSFTVDRTDGARKEIGVVSTPSRQQQSFAIAGTTLASAADAACICIRKVECIFCEECGFYDGKGEIKKYMQCVVHPNKIQGITKCPVCNAGPEALVERAS